MNQPIVIITIIIIMACVRMRWHAIACNRRWLLILMLLLIPFLGIRNITFTTFFILLVVTIYLRA